MKIPVLATLAMITIAGSVDSAFAETKSFTCFNKPHNGVGYAYQFKRLDKEASVDIYRVDVFHGEFISGEKIIYSGVVSVIETQNNEMVLKSDVLALVANKTLSVPEDSTGGVVIHSPAQIISNGELFCRIGEVGDSI